MKNLLVLFLFLFLFSCDLKKDLSDYKGGVIYDKRMDLLTSELYVTIKYKNRFKSINVYRLDYSKYNIGDTIK